MLLREAEIGFLTIHFGASLERKGFHNDAQPQQSHPRIKVALVCIAGVAMALLLKEKLIRKFGDVLEIVRTSPAQQVDEALLNAVDLILTTVDLSNLHSNKIIKIGLFPDEDDFKMISQVIQRIARRKQSIIQPSLEKNYSLPNSNCMTSMKSLILWQMP